MHVCLSSHGLDARVALLTLRCFQRGTNSQQDVFVRFRHHIESSGLFLSTLADLNLEGTVVLRTPGASEQKTQADAEDAAAAHTCVRFIAHKLLSDTQPTSATGTRCSKASACSVRSLIV